MIKSKRVKMDNIVKISGGTIKEKGIAPYFESIVMRVQPDVYNEYNEIKIRFTKDLWKEVWYLMCMFWHLGLVCNRIERMPHGLPLPNGTVLDDAYEAIITKIGANMFEDNTDYSDRMDKLWERRDDGTK